MARKPKKVTLASLKRTAPKCPGLTCISIDKVIGRLEKSVEKKKVLQKKQLKEMTKRLENLRSANESLRESGIYWYEKLKLLLKNR